jgi:hypothetical protein
MILSAPPAESMILSAHAESIILSAGRAKQQSTKSCNRKCGNNDSSRGDRAGSDGFDVGSNKDDCSDDSNGNGNVDGGNGNGDSGDNNRSENIMLSAGGTESIILSVPSLKPYPLQKS